MSQKIMDQGRVLAEMIAESEELKQVRQAEADLANDPIAQELIGELQSLQKKEAESKQQGKDLSQEDNDKLIAVEAQMENNATISTFLSAQHSFNGMMDGISYLLMKGINGDVDEDSCNAEGCGGGCGGCGH